MEAKYIFYIIAVVILGGIALYAINKFPSVKGKIKLPGGIEAEGEGTNESPDASAETEIGGNVRDGARLETTSNDGPAITKVNGDVSNAVLKTTVKKG